MTPENSTITHQFALAYPTLIGKFQISNAEKVNAGLLSLLMDREKLDATDNHANVGGWHSQATLLDWPGYEVSTLKSWISEGLSRTVQASAQLPEVQVQAPPRGNFRVSAWANISRRGNYHRIHNHPNSAWSGVYYVATGTTNDSLGGVLEFYDPRPFTEMVDVPLAPYGRPMHIRPVPGLMVVFPGWLYHFVHPNMNDDVRVSIAFNATWHPL